jgi:hypothetical protein
MSSAPPAARLVSFTLQSGLGLTLQFSVYVAENDFLRNKWIFEIFNASEILEYFSFEKVLGQLAQHPEEEG